MRSTAFIVAAALAASLGTVSAQAANLVANGSFSSSSYASNSEFGLAYGGQGVTSWTGNDGYDIFFTSAAASSTVNTAGQYSYTGNEKLWGPVPSSPGGGSFVALDGDSTAGVQGGISQAVGGLAAGQGYTLSFDWAAAQVQSRTGATTESLQVSLGGQTFTTPVVSNPSKGLTGWFSQAFTFTASTSSEVLSFLSVGTPQGLPPIALLDDVSLTPAPEPVSLALLGAGLAGLGVVRRRRKG